MAWSDLYIVPGLTTFYERVRTEMWTKIFGLFITLNTINELVSTMHYRKESLVLGP